MPDYLVARDKKNNEKYYVCVIRSRWTSSQFWTTNQSHHVPLMPPLCRAGATIWATMRISRALRVMIWGFASATTLTRYVPSCSPQTSCHLYKLYKINIKQANLLNWEGAFKGGVYRHLYCISAAKIRLWCSQFSFQLSGNAVFSDHSIWGL